MILGSTPITEVEKVLAMNLDELDVDTVAGVLMSRLGKIPQVGDVVDFGEVSAEVLETKHDHADRIRFTLTGEAKPVEPNKDEH